MDEQDTAFCVEKWRRLRIYSPLSCHGVLAGLYPEQAQPIEHVGESPRRISLVPLDDQREQGPLYARVEGDVDFQGNGDYNP